MKDYSKNIKNQIEALTELSNTLKIRSRLLNKESKDTFDNALKIDEVVANLTIILNKTPDVVNMVSTMNKIQGLMQFVKLDNEIIEQTENPSIKEIIEECVSDEDITTQSENVVDTVEAILDMPGESEEDDALPEEIIEPEASNESIDKLFKDGDDEPVEETAEPANAVEEVNDSDNTVEDAAESTNVVEETVEPTNAVEEAADIISDIDIDNIEIDDIDVDEQYLFEVLLEESNSKTTEEPTSKPTTAQEESEVKSAETTEEPTSNSTTTQEESASKPTTTQEEPASKPTTTQEEPEVILVSNYNSTSKPVNNTAPNNTTNTVSNTAPNNTTNTINKPNKLDPDAIAARLASMGL